MLCKLEQDDILKHIFEFQNNDQVNFAVDPPYGNEDTAIKITDILEKNFI